MDITVSFNPLFAVAAAVIFTVGFICGVLYNRKHRGDDINLPHIAHASVVFMGIIIAPFSVLIELNISTTAVAFWIASALAFYGVDAGVMAGKFFDAAISSRGTANKK